MSTDVLFSSFELILVGMLPLTTRSIAILSAPERDLEPVLLLVERPPSELHIINSTWD